jgi:trimethylamine--corrinoid protein Co-methyltransferase
MKPTLQLLTEKTVSRIIDEGYSLLEDPGVIIQNPEMLKILDSYGINVNPDTQIVSISENIARDVISFCPEHFSLYSIDGSNSIDYGSDQTYFNPGSSALTILDRESQRARPPTTADFVKFIKIVEGLPDLDAQSTAMVCSDVVEEIKDLYRLYIALIYGSKPIVTGAFREDTLNIMIDMLTAVSGGIKNLQDNPIAIFDVCPSAPLKWSRLASQNLIDCATRGIPVQIVSMPIAGATAPVTLAGAVVQHTAECLSGVIFAQIIKKGASVVWGGSPAVFDMKKSTTPMGAVGSWLISAANVQVAKALSIPTQAYLGISDAKVLDSQSGMESSASTLLAGLTGVDMVSGAGMLAFENCQSPEKLVLDAEMIAMTKHFLNGIQIRDEPIAADLIREVGHNSDFLTNPHTLRWFKEEFHYPSSVIDRNRPDEWERKGANNSWERAIERVDQLEAQYEGIRLDDQLITEIRKIVTKSANTYGMADLPSLPGSNSRK